MTDPIDYTRLPRHLQNGVRRYIEHGIKPGSFLRAVIQNNLYKAFSRADPVSRENLDNIVLFFYNRTPPACWGSKERMLEWIKQGGLEKITQVKLARTKEFVKE